MKRTDQRITYANARVEHEGHVWHIDGKSDPDMKILKVYRVHGDVSNPNLLREALQSFADDAALSLKEQAQQMCDEHNIQARRSEALALLRSAQAVFKDTGCSR